MIGPLLAWVAAQDLPDLLRLLAFDETRVASVAGGRTRVFRTR